MKKLLILAVVAALSFWGCSDSTSLTEPTSAQSNQSFLKITSNNVSELSVEAKASLEFEGVSTLEKSYFPSSVSAEISEDGGVIRFILADNGIYSIGKLSIEEDSFEDEVEVGVAMVDGEAALDFTPDAEFSDAAELTVGFIGVDVQAGDVVNFVYMDGDDEVAVDNSGIIVGNGWVVVIKAQLGHFSRFGFTK